MLAKYLNFVAFLLLTSPLLAQEAPKTLTARFITEDIHLDGVLDESAWQTADKAHEFWQFFPTDSARAQYPTEVKILYSETTLYVGIRAESPNNKYVVSTLRRDFGGTTNDNVSLLFDTFLDGTNAFFFGVTPYGVQREGLVSGGGTARDGFNNNWDIKWQTESQMYDDHYVVEIAIPFTSLKFEEGATHWRFRAYRWNLQTNEQSTWVRVPQNQLLSSLAFMGDLVFEKPLGRSRTPFAIIPYINALTQKDFVTDKGDNDFKFGGDAKIAVGNGMNLDLTINPDFSNVEVDDIFTNLTRFELRLPEKRQFFIDNNDLFDNFGNTFNEARPFFSRRIGLARDTSGNLIQNQILGGARLSGKANENWRLGVLNIQTAEDADNEIPSYNNMMLAVQRKVAARSNIGAFLVNRQTFGDYEFLEERNQYNRVIGADYNLASEDGVWTGKFYAHKSFQPGDSKGNLSSQAMVIYNTRNWTYIQDWVYIDQDFRADLGFVPRTDIFKSGNGLTRTFYPKKGALSYHSTRLLSIIYWKPSLDMKKTDHNYRVTWTANFKSQAVFSASYSNNQIFLSFPFDPSRSGGEPLPANEGYTFNQFNTTFTSNNTSLLTYAAEATAGQFFNGNQYSFAGTLGYRVQPWAQWSLALNYDGIRLPAPHNDADLWLLTSRLDITFSKSLFWSNIIQYSNQRDNLGINSRLQWRFAPLSDLYLVYNDNYFTSHFEPRFRSVNLKVTYWLNI
jgi:hypothetical protein